MNRILTIKNVLIGIAVIIFDLAVYLFLGLLLMNYDDFYDESKGEYWSLESMTTSDKITYFGLQFWHLVNIVLIIYVLYRIVKGMRKNALQQSVIRNVGKVVNLNISTINKRCSSWIGRGFETRTTHTPGRYGQFSIYPSYKYFKVS